MATVSITSSAGARKRRVKSISNLKLPKRLWVLRARFLLRNALAVGDWIVFSCLVLAIGKSSIRAFRSEYGDGFVVDLPSCFDVWRDCPLCLQWRQFWIRRILHWRSFLTRMI